MGPPAFLAVLLFAIVPRAWLDRLRPWANSMGPIVVAIWLATWLARLVFGASARGGGADDSAAYAGGS